MKYLMTCILLLCSSLVWSCNNRKPEPPPPTNQCTSHDSCPVRLHLERYVCTLLADTKAGKVKWEKNGISYRVCWTNQYAAIYAYDDQVVFSFRSDIKVLINNQCAKELYSVVRMTTIDTTHQREEEAIKAFLDGVGG